MDMLTTEDVTMAEPGDKAFKIIKTSIGTGPSNDRLSTDILGIKCNTGARFENFLLKPLISWK